MTHDLNLTNEPEDFVLYDIGDTIFFLGHHSQVTGIQRVVTAFIEALKINSTNFKNYKFIAFSQSLGTYVVIDNSATHAIFDEVGFHGVTPIIKSQFHKMAGGDYSQLQGIQIDFSEYRNAKISILGAAWMFDIIPTLRWAKTEFNVNISCLIYDIIPITYPQYVTHELRDVFIKFIDSITDIADILFTISKYISNELSKYIDNRGLRRPEIYPLQLSTFSTNVRGTKRSIRDLIGTRSYVLYVSTIEARKNHRCLFDIWCELARDNIDVPDLVFVGRAGWKVDDLIAEFSQTQFIDGRLHVLSDVSDSELMQLYTNALFLAYPSFCEGWGLPVTEALSLGTPALCSNTTSLPEAGQNVAHYLSPHDRNAWKQTILEWITDTKLRSRFDFTKFEIPGWKDIIQELTDVLIQTPMLPERPPMIRARATVQFGAKPTSDILAIAKFDRRNNLGTMRHKPGELRYGPNWSFREDWGHWSLRGILRLSFMPVHVESHVVLLFLRVPETLLGKRFAINLNGNREVITIETVKIVLCIPMSDKIMSIDRSNIIEISIIDKGMMAVLAEVDIRQPTLGLECINIVRIDDMPVWTTLSVKMQQENRDIEWVFA